MSTKFIAIFFLFPFISYNFQTIVPNNIVNLSNGEIDIIINTVGSINDPTQYTGTDDSLFNQLNLANGGFFVSGKLNDEIFVSANVHLMRINDFVEGKIGDDTTSNKIYIINKNDTPFGNSWIKWKDAVKLGAEFYDGDLNGVYDPIDRNQNNIWDENEDRPPNLGEVYSWCTFNDGVPKILRYLHSNPMGIEIQQTLFLNKKLLTSYLDRILFVRYRIINKGNVAEKFDSSFFSIFADFDTQIDYGEDLMGCDTIRRSAFVYKEYWDNTKKKNESIFSFAKFLSLPYSTQKSSNDSKIVELNNGFLGVDTLNHYYYSNLSSIYDRWAGNIGPNDPFDTQSTFKLQKYGNPYGGNLINPCDYSLGQVNDLDCNTVNPIFMFSGNPTTNFGWINLDTDDHSVIISSGPFQLEKDKPIDIWVCYSSVKGDSLEDAYNKMLEIDNYAQTFYNYNFFIEPPTPSINNTDLNDYDFYLWNNYPNPFNNSTKIRYNLDRTEHTTLKVFNVLGEEIKTLVSEIQDKGVYEVDFNAENLPSGIYFYRLQQNAFFWTRKMIYLR